MEIFDRKLSGMCLIEWVKERGGEERKKKKKGNENIRGKTEQEIWLFPV